MRALWMFPVLIALPLIAQSVPNPPNSGRIIGQVVNDAGEPIAKARLCWGHYGDNFGSSTCGGREADDQGHFTIPVPVDTNRIWAEKPADGYWTNVDMATSVLTLSLTPQRPSAHILIKLGSKPARVNFNVVDRNTGGPIKDFDISVASVDQSISTRAQTFNQSSIAIPPDKDVLIIVQANGYKRWFYMESGGSQPTVRLQSGEERNVEADLEPEAKRN